MKEYARFDHIRQLRADVLPKVENFTKLLDIYTKDNIDMRECIEKFDKTLSLKSNKADIITMKHQFSLDYVEVRKWKKIEEELL